MKKVEHLQNEMTYDRITMFKLKFKDGNYE